MLTCQSGQPFPHKLICNTDEFDTGQVEFQLGALSLVSVLTGKGNFSWDSFHRTGHFEYLVSWF